MRETELPCVKHESSAEWFGLFLAVDWIVDDGVADMAQVDADLVCAAGVEVTVEQSDGAGIEVP